MIYTFGRSAVSALIPAALTMRIYWGLAVDFPYALNASWMCPLIGFLIALPLLFAIEQAAKLSSGSPWENLCGSVPRSMTMLAELLYTILLVYDVSLCVRLIASSSNIIALNDVTVHLLVVPACAVIAAAVMMGGDAVGNSARIWLRVLPLFAVMLIIVQIKSYRFRWLTPILGSGAADIIRASVYCAGCTALAGLSGMLAVPDRRRFSISRSCMYSSVAAAILLLALRMSFPTMTGTSLTQAARIELILSNGRMSRSPQLILDILWYGGLLYLIAAEAVVAAAFLKRCIPKAPVWVIAAAEATTVAVAAVFNGALLKRSDRLTGILFIIIGSTFAVVLLAAYFSRRRDVHAH